MSDFILNNSSYGDIIMMTVRGQAAAEKNINTDGPVFDTMRRLGIDRLKDCTLFPGF